MVHVLVSLFFLSLSLFNSVNAAALTTAISPNERLCFHADVDKAGEKLGVSMNALLIRQV